MSKDKFAQIRQEAATRDVEFVDLKLLDIPGRLHHVSFPFQRFTPEACGEGIGFDGSSYGFLKVEDSDMVLIPDLETAHLDPFRKLPTLTMFAEARLTDEQRSPFPLDGRGVARRAEQTLRQLKIADRSLWATEYEFYIFDEAEFLSDVSKSAFAIQSEERFFQNAYHACNPHDRYDDFRDEACSVMREFGITIRYHHHEFGAQGQQEIEGWFADLPTTGDHAVLAKYILFNLAEQHGLKVTFMPKPLYDNAGSGWHLHQFLSKDGVNLFSDESGYAGLSKTALHYIGGVLRHSDALSAFTNPSTNSYKRLVPGFEAPTARTFGRSNRSAAIRIPSYVTDPNYRRIEYRPPDLTCNPYLCTAAILMAGLDGILGEIEPIRHGFAPEDAPSPDAEQSAKNFLPRSLADALDALERDHQFLLRNDVFSEALVQRWLEVKRQEIRSINRRPHPFEFTMYFDF